MSDSENCTLDTCPISEAYVEYVPNLAGNVLYLALFGVMLLAQIVMGISWRTWTYLIGMLGGLVLEVVGYIGRVQMHYNPFEFNNFLEYLICLTIGPAFLSASIYVCFGRIVTVYGEHISRIRPRTYTIIFVCCDLISLILQAAGGAITATADDDQPDQSQQGVNIMIAGLSSQVASLAIFMVLAGDFAWRVHKTPETLNWAFRGLRNSLKWKAFLLGLATATVTIFVRSIFRVAELKNGFSGSLANDEVAFMILEGAMMVIACLCLTIFHPGYCFDGQWKDMRKTTNNKAQDSQYSLQGLTGSGRSV